MQDNVNLTSSHEYWLRRFGLHTLGCYAHSYWDRRYLLNGWRWTLQDYLRGLKRRLT